MSVIPSGGTPMSLDSGSLSRTVTVQNPQGLHMRPATAFAKIAREYACDVRVLHNGSAVNGKSQIELLLLAAEAGTALTLEVDGPDAEAALDRLAAVLAAASCDDDE